LLLLGKVAGAGSSPGHRSLLAGHPLDSSARHAGRAHDRARRKIYWAKELRTQDLVEPAGAVGTLGETVVFLLQCPKT